MAVHGTGLPANRDDQRSGPLPLDSDGTVLLSHPLSWPSAPISYCSARLAPDAADPPSMSASETVDGRLQFFPGLGLGEIQHSDNHESSLHEGQRNDTYVRSRWQLERPLKG